MGVLLENTYMHIFKRIEREKAAMKDKIEILP